MSTSFPELTTPSPIFNGIDLLQDSRTFGVKVLDDLIYVTCRDGIKRLHDYNSDGETDFIESFWNAMTSHVFSMDTISIYRWMMKGTLFSQSRSTHKSSSAGSIMKVPLRWRGRSCCMGCPYTQWHGPTSRWLIYCFRQPRTLDARWKNIGN